MYCWSQSLLAQWRRCPVAGGYRRTTVASGMAVNIGSASVVFERFKALCWHVMRLGEAAHSGWVSKHHYRSETVERRWKFDSGAAVTSTVPEPARESSARSRPAGSACAAELVWTQQANSLGKLPVAASLPWQADGRRDTVVTRHRRCHATAASRDFFCVLSVVQGSTYIVHVLS